MPIGTFHILKLPDFRVLTPAEQFTEALKYGRPVDFFKGDQPRQLHRVLYRYDSFYVELTFFQFLDTETEAGVQVFESIHDLPSRYESYRIRMSTP